MKHKLISVSIGFNEDEPFDVFCMNLNDAKELSAMPGCTYFSAWAVDSPEDECTIENNITGMIIDEGRC